jgi:hypothetical protein
VWRSVMVESFSFGASGWVVAFSSASLLLKNSFRALVARSGRACAAAIPLQASRVL